MKRSGLKTLMLLVFVLAAVPLYSQGTEPEETGIPGIAIDAAEHDFGEIFWGRPVTHTFRVYNRSDAPVAISMIRSDCGCQTTADTDAPIEPGHYRLLTVTYEPEYHLGKFTKSITVYTDRTDDAGHPAWFECRVRGHIISVLSLDPWHVYFRRVIRGQQAETTVKIESVPGISVAIRDVATGSEHLEASLETVSDPGKWLLSLNLLETAPAGAFSASVAILTDHPEQHSIHVPVLAYIRGPVSVHPTQCYLGTLVPGETVDRTFTVEKTGDPADLAPPAIASAPDWLSGNVETVHENRSYKVKISVTVPENMTGRMTGSFRIETSDDTTPYFEIPVFGYILPESFRDQPPVSGRSGARHPDDTAEPGGPDPLSD